MENYVSKLNEHGQKTKSHPRYEEVGCVGPDHNKTWVSGFIWWHVWSAEFGESGRLLLEDGAWQKMEPDLTLSAHKANWNDP